MGFQFGQSPITSFDATSPSTMTLGASQAANTKLLALSVNDTQANSVFAEHITLGTSGKSAVLILGTGSTGTGAADKHLILWGNTAANANKVLSIGNGTSFTETIYMLASGIIQGPAAAGLRLQGPSGTAYCTLDSATGAQMGFSTTASVIFAGTRTTFAGGAVAYTIPTLSTSVRYAGSYLVNTTAVGNVGAGTDDLMSGTVFTGTLANNGDRLIVRCTGTFANNANSKQALLVLGSTTLVDSGASTSYSNAGWVLECFILRTGAATQEITARFSVNGDAVAPVVTRTAGAENLATNLTLKMQAVGVDNDDIVQRSMTWDWFPVPAQAA